MRELDLEDDIYVNLCIDVITEGTSALFDKYIKQTTQFYDNHYRLQMESLSNSAKKGTELVTKFRQERLKTEARLVVTNQKLQNSKKQAEEIKLNFQDKLKTIKKDYSM